MGWESTIGGSRQPQTRSHSRLRLSLLWHGGANSGPVPLQVGLHDLAHRTRRIRGAARSRSSRGFTGFKTATTEELLDAAAVMDSFHVVRFSR